MQLKEIRMIATGMDIKPGRANKTDLIHTIQQREGNLACFATPYRDECEQGHCLWREDCVDTAITP